MHKITQKTPGIQQLRLAHLAERGDPIWGGLHLNNGDPKEKNWWKTLFISFSCHWDWFDLILIKIPFPGNGHFFANKKVTCAKLSRTPCLSVAEPMLGNNASYEDSFITCQITPNDHGSLPDSLACLHQGIPSQDNLLLTSSFYQGLLGPKKNHFDFRQLLRGTFAELSWKYPDPQTRAISIFLEFGFWNLGCCVWNLSLGNSKSNIRQYQRQVQAIIFRCGKAVLESSVPTYERKAECPKTPNRELKQNQTEILQRPSPARPRATGGGSPLQVIYLSKLKSGERLTPPKANVCGERCARAVRACGARYMRAVMHAVRDTRAQW